MNPLDFFLFSAGLFILSMTILFWAILATVILEDSRSGKKDSLAGRKNTGLSSKKKLDTL